MVTTCNLLQHSRMCSKHRHSSGWSSSSDQVCPLSAFTWKLSDEHHGSSGTPGEHGVMRCRYTWSMARVYNRPCCQAWNYKIHQHTYSGYSPDYQIECRWNQGLPPPGRKVEAGNSLAAFDTLCVCFGLHTPSSTRCTTGETYLLSAKRESMNSIYSALDSTQGGSKSTAMFPLADCIKWDLTILTCAWTSYWFESVISNVSHCLSIPLSRSSLCVP